MGDVGEIDPAPVNGPGPDAHEMLLDKTRRLEAAVLALQDLIMKTTLNPLEALETADPIPVDAINNAKEAANHVKEHIAVDIAKALDAVQVLPNTAAEKMTLVGQAAVHFKTGIDDAIADRQRDLGQMRESLVQITLDLGRRSEDEMERMVSSMVRNVTDSVNEALSGFEQSLRAEIEAKLRQAVADAVSGIISTGEIAAAGATISGVLAPWLPTIAAAIRIIDVLDDALALMRNA